MHFTFHYFPPSQRGETNEQKEVTEEGQHDLQTTDVNVKEDQAPKYSLTEKHAAETAATTTSEKVKLHKLILWKYKIALFNLKCTAT